METIQQLIEKILSDGRPAVLAMIVNVEGSAYRKEGAWMLIRENDSQIGVISGGCLESDLQSRARKLFNTGKAEIHRYDLSAEDDLGWGRGAGCNGVVTVMIRDINSKFRRAITFLNEQLLAKDPVTFIQSMDNFDMYSFRSRNGEQYGDLDYVSQDEFSITTPFQHIAGQKAVGDDTVYHQLLWPMPNLYIFGAGVDARPLAQLAARVGYAVHMLDWRESLCNEVHFPKAKSFQTGNVEKLIGNITFSSLDSVVVLTHDFQKDLMIMQQLRPSRLLYFGILGSKKRTLRLLGGEIPDWVRSPVGLSIGADGPEEIAVSIIAELIAVKRRKKI